MLLLFVRASAFEPAPERFLEADVAAADDFAREVAPFFAERDTPRFAFSARIAATRAFAAFDERETLPDRSSVWPGKITGFLSPLIRIRRSSARAVLPRDAA